MVADDPGLTTCTAHRLLFIQGNAFCEGFKGFFDLRAMHRCYQGGVGGFKGFSHDKWKGTDAMAWVGKSYAAVQQFKLQMAGIPM